MFWIFEIDSEESESETVGGLIFENLGGIPQVGDHIVLGRLDAVVTEISGRRISKLRITLLEAEDEPEEEEESHFFRSKITTSGIVTDPRHAPNPCTVRAFACVFKIRRNI